jgi:hypothetical protein
MRHFSWLSIVLNAFGTSLAPPQASRRWVLQKVTSSTWEARRRLKQAWPPALTLVNVVHGLHAWTELYTELYWACFPRWFTEFSLSDINNTVTWKCVRSEQSLKLPGHVFLNMISECQFLPDELLSDLANFPRGKLWELPKPSVVAPRSMPMVIFRDKFPWQARVNGRTWEL